MAQQKKTPNQSNTQASHLAIGAAFLAIGGAFFALETIRWGGVTFFVLGITFIALSQQKPSAKGKKKK
jgi:hypothetical protein